jgi:uncharacterized membrane-anchored protein
MRYLFIAGFFVMVAAQWYVPVSMILDTNATIDEGVEYLFKTRPIDPADPFRGRYITLSYDAEVYNPRDTNQAHFDYYSEVYATLGTDSTGFAKVIYLSALPPKAEAGKHGYIPVKVTYASVYEGTAEVQLSFPFNRFYVEESKASEAEQLYWSTRGDSTNVCYAKVRVRNGKAILTDVMVNDSSIVDVVRRINADKQN